MIDNRLLKTQSEYLIREFKRRGLNGAEIVFKWQIEEEKRKKYYAECENLRQKRNKISKEISLKRSIKESNITSLLTKSKKIGDQLLIKQHKLNKITSNLEDIRSTLPNLLDPSVPDGGENDYIEIKRVGALPKFDFEPKDHLDLGKTKGFLDMEIAAEISKSRFSVLYDKLALLQRCLIWFMLDIHTQKHGYLEVSVPLIVNEKTLFNSGQLPKFGDELFMIQNHSSNQSVQNKKFGLIPTAEVPVTNLVSNRILTEQELPLKFVCYSSCFRREAGSYGRDTRGLIRKHQFEKVELVMITKSSESSQALTEIVSNAETILKLLELPYRIILKAAQDTGICSCKTYDLEVWLPSQNCYREISSCSNCGDFQARRMNTRVRCANGKNEFVHTLNGSGIAVDRTLVALLENNQNAQGKILIPKVLRNYFNSEYL